MIISGIKFFINVVYVYFMKNNLFLKSAFYFSIIGVIFSGYYSAVKIFSSACPFGESCPEFLGYPACYFGFILFLLCLISGGLTVFVNRKIITALVVVGVLGVIFSGYLSYIDLWQTSCPGGQCHYQLGLPTCVYGFIFFVIILFSSVIAFWQRNEK